MRSVIFVGLMATLLSLPVQAKLYRWVDENGKVQFSDKPPQTSPQSSVSEVDSRGRVIKAPVKPISDEEKAKQQEAQAKLKEQQRRDRALLQSFSSPKDVDFLRDRQIESIQATIQTNKLRRQTAEGKLARIDDQIAKLQKRKRAVPVDLDAERAIAQKELDDIDADTRKQFAAIEEVKQRAEDDKKRLIELQAGQAH